MDAPLVDAQSLRFRWPGADVDTLDIPALRLAPGEQWFLRGASGSGKSTLLALLAGVLQPTAGRLQVLGQDLGKLGGPARDRLRADHLGVIFQQFNLLSWLSAHDNVTLALRFSARRRAQAAAGDAGRLMAAMGLAEPLWRQPAARLSVGQQQRVAAARALIGRPALILADEPTSALDEDARDAFMALLQQCCAEAGSALVFVSHDARLAQRFAHVADLSALNHAADLSALNHAADLSALDRAAAGSPRDGADAARDRRGVDPASGTPAAGPRDPTAPTRGAA